MITLPSDFTTQVASSTTNLLGQLTPYTTMIVGVLLAGLLIAVIIGALKH